MNKQIIDIKKKKVIILGCSGMLGYTLFRFLYSQTNVDVYGTLRSQESLKFFSKEQRKSISLCKQIIIAL